MAVETSPHSEETLDLIFREVKAKQDELHGVLRTNDTKAFAILAAASLITASPTVRLISQQFHAAWPAAVALLIAGGCYLALLYQLYHAAMPRDVNFPPEPTRLYPAYLDASPTELKLKIIETIVNALPANDRQVYAKAAAVDTALKLLLAESFFIALGFVLG